MIEDEIDLVERARARVGSANETGLSEGVAPSRLVGKRPVRE